LKLNSVTRAWAKFLSLEPYHQSLPPQVRAFYEEDLAALKQAAAEYADKVPIGLTEMLAKAEARVAPSWKEGVIPGEWLVGQIRDSCEFMPAPVVGREMYCAAGFVPADGVLMSDLPSVGRRRERYTEVE
jgi:hypothetical protein